jgi:predicted acyltransferase
MMTMTAAPAAHKRIDSMDQFRGYTVAGMFLVNFIGSFLAVPGIFKHHNTYVSYADTIMPQFFFAVGFALRLVVLRNIAVSGREAALRKAVWRCVALAVVGLVVHRLDGNYRTWKELADAGAWGALSSAFWRSPFQALTHIAVTSLWVLPVIAASARPRILFALVSGLAHLGLSAWFWYDLLQAKRVIDGGPLGFLTWAIPTLAGSFAYDAVVALEPGAAWRSILKWSAPLMLAGYALSCLGGLTLVPPPFFPPAGSVNLWTMSQRAGSLSYLTFSAGFSLAVYALFIWMVDQRGWRSLLCEDFGRNALAAYILHDLVRDVVRPFAPRDSPGWWIAVTFLVFFAVTWRMVRYLNQQGLWLRL